MPTPTALDRIARSSRQIIQFADVKGIAQDHVQLFMSDVERLIPVGNVVASAINAAATGVAINNDPKIAAIGGHAPGDAVKLVVNEEVTRVPLARVSAKLGWERNG